jgi:hypothetical protein
MGGLFFNWLHGLDWLDCIFEVSEIDRFGIIFHLLIRILVGMFVNIIDGFLLLFISGFVHFFPLFTYYHIYPCVHEFVIDYTLGLPFLILLCTHILYNIFEYYFLTAYNNIYQIIVFIFFDPKTNYQHISMLITYIQLIHQLCIHFGYPSI